jgi:F-type H+-transporting ATPase subunit b
MNINATLLGQVLVFVILIWFTVKFIWPQLLNAVEERQKKIADGLAFAEKSEKSLAQAKNDALDIIKDARAQASKIVDQANKRSNELIDEAKHGAVSEGQRLIGEAKQVVALEGNRARSQLRNEVAKLVVAGTSQLLGREVDAKAHADLLEKLALEIERG